MFFLNNHLIILIDTLSFIFEFDEVNKLGYFDNAKYIRRIVNLQSFTVRSLRELQQTRVELKLAHFDRKRLQTFATYSHISISYLLFIDDFDVYRNMYRALKAFYLILAYLDYQERRKLTNVFTLLLSSYETKIEKIIKVFYKSIQRLNSEVNLDINEHIKIV